MTKTLILFDNLSDEYRHQELWDPDENKCLFSVSDLWECPEDAIIDRDLFNAHDASGLIKLGIEYSNKGYSSVEYNEIIVPYDEDMDECIEEHLNKWKETQS